MASSTCWRTRLRDVESPAGEQGKTLTLTSDPPTPQDKDVTITQIVFQICAKTASAGSVQVRVDPYLVAGPQWKSQSVEASEVIFADLPNDIQTHAIRYAASSSGATSDQAVATSGVADH